MNPRLLLALASPLLALLLQWSLWPWISPFVWFLFYPAVFFSARLAGLKGGMLSTLLSIVIVCYFFMPPRLSWSLQNPANLYSVALFLLMGYLFSRTHERLNRLQSNTETALGEIFEQAAVGIAMVSLDGRWLRVNRRLCDIVGYRPDELLATNFQAMTHPDEFESDLHLVQQVLAGEIKTFSLEKRYFHKKGHTVWTNLTVSLVRKADGRPDYFISVVEEIETRKQAEEALRSSTEQLGLFIAHAPAAIAMFDRDMRYLAVSNRWLSDYGLGGQSVIGRSHYEIFPEIPSNWRSYHQRGLDGEVVKADDDRFERLDGSVQWVRWEIWPWHSHGRVGGILIFTEDITRFKQAELEVRALNASLERRVEERTAELSAANRELDAFAYAVSHDLRAPLRAMSGFADALREDFADRFDDNGRLYLQQIEIASHKMGDLIDALLALSRSTRGELSRETVDLSAMALRIADEMRGGEAQRRVAVDIEPGVKGVGDNRMLEIVMRNLLANAWKYTAYTEPATIRVYAEQQGDQCWYCVADNGAGFDMAHAQRLFQAFQRLHRQDEFSGIGIGLATVQRIIHRHGGIIEASAAPGRGATFRFTLHAPTSFDHKGD